MKQLLALVIVLLFCVPRTGWSQSVTVRELAGGATLLVAREPKSPRVVIEALFRVGVGDENAVGESGLSALLARTWASGGSNRSAAQLARDIGHFGALGIWSTSEYIELWTVSSYSESDVAAQTLLANIVTSPVFPTSAITLAKRDVERDRQIRSDGIVSEAMNRLRSRVFVTSSAGRDPLGDPTNIVSLDAAALRRFHDRTVGSDASRAVFVVMGDIEPDEAERMIRSGLSAGDWQAWRTPTHATKPVSLQAEDTIPVGLKPLDLHRSAPARYAVIGFIAPGTTSGSKSFLILQLLDAVIGGGKECRLFALRDRVENDSVPISYDIRSRIDAGRDQSLWVVSVEGATVPIMETRTVIERMLKGIADGSRPITADELARARQYLKGKHRRERQRITDRASALGYAQIMGLGVAYEAEFEAQLDQISLEEVNNLARQIFTAPDAIVVTGTDPVH